MPDGILVRSASMHDMDLPDSLLAIARAGAGTNNIPIDECTRRGIVVFNTPGANANAVAELVICGLMLGAVTWPAGSTGRALWTDRARRSPSWWKRARLSSPVPKSAERRWA